MTRIKLVSFLLGFLLLLSACNHSDSGDTVTFYYARNPQHKTAPIETFCTAETRNITSQNTNLRYLLSLYLQGPLDSNSVSPFPANTQLVKLDMHNRQFFIQLSQEFAELSGIDLTVACTCISLTCFDLADVDRVTVFTPASEDYPAVEVTLSREDLTLTDTVTGNTQSP